MTGSVHDLMQRETAACQAAIHAAMRRIQTLQTLFCNIPAGSISLSGVQFVTLIKASHTQAHAQSKEADIASLHLSGLQLSSRLTVGFNADPTLAGPVLPRTPPGYASQRLSVQS